MLPHLLLVDGFMSLQRFPDSAIQVNVGSVADNTRSWSESPYAERVHRYIENQRTEG
jgi:hypothetical protein